MQLDSGEVNTGNEILPPAGAHVMHFPGELDNTYPGGYKVPPFEYYEGSPDALDDEYWNGAIDPARETDLGGVVLEDGMVAWGEHVPTHDILTAVTGRRRLAQFEARWEGTGTNSAPQSILIAVDRDYPTAADHLIGVLQRNVDHPNIGLNFVIRGDSTGKSIPLQAYGLKADT